MKAWQGALLGGSVGALAVLGVLTFRKVSAVQDWASELQEAAQGGTAQTELQEYAGYLRQRLAAVAAERTTVLAKQTADATLGDYGLTPERIAAMQRLAQTFGV